MNRARLTGRPSLPRTASTFALVALGLSVASVVAASIRPSPPPRNWALIVSAATLASPDAPPGPNLPTRFLARQLQELYGFAPENVVELYGPEATTGNAYRAIRDLGERVGSRDTVLVTLSPSGAAPPAMSQYSRSLNMPAGEPAVIGELLEALAGLNAATTLVVIDRVDYCSRDPLPVVGAEQKMAQRGYYDRGGGGALHALVACSSNPGMIGSGYLLDLTEVLGAMPDLDRDGSLSAGEIGRELEQRLKARNVRVQLLWSTPYGWAPERPASAESELRLKPTAADLAPALVAGIAKGRPEAQRLEAIETLSRTASSTPGGAGTASAMRAAHLLLDIAVDPADDFKVRRAAVMAMGGLGPPAVSSLQTVVEGSAPAALRAVAVSVLAQIEGDEATERLEAALGNEDASVRRAAATALADRRSARSAPLVAERMRHESDARVVRAQLEALQALRPREEDALPAIAAVLARSGDDADLRAAAVATLGTLAYPGGRPYVLARLQGDGNSWVRQTAAYALARIADDPDPGETRHVLKASLEDANPGVREAAAFALGRLGGAEAVTELARRLKRDDNPRVRAAAADALGGSGQRRAVEPLIDALGDASPDVRRSAAAALGKLDDGAAVSRLALETIKDPDPGVAEAARRALDQIRTSPGTVDLGRLAEQARADGDPTVRLASLTRLAETESERAIPVLVDALQDDDYAVRQAATEALAAFPAPSATAALATALRSPSPASRQGAADALGRSHRPEALAVLLGAFPDADAIVRPVLVRALGNFTDPGAVAAVKATAESKERGLMVAAADALRMQGEAMLMAGNASGSVPLLELATQTHENALGADHPTVAGDETTLALAYRRTGNAEAAEMVLIDALRVSEAAFGQNDPAVADALSGLASVYVERGEFGRAEPLLFRALRIRESTAGSGASVALALDDLVFLYSAQGKSDLAGKYRELAERQREQPQRVIRK